MLRRRVRISARDGVHARPVAELARLTLAYGGPVSLTTAHGVEVDLRSVLAVMDLALTPGDEVVLATPPAEGAEETLDALADVLAPPAV